MNSTSTNPNFKPPFRIEVSRIVQARYGTRYLSIPSSTSVQPGFDAALTKPLAWEERVSGQDIVEGSDGNTYVLSSDGSQSVPQPGWVLMAVDGDPKTGFSWTLYGILPNSGTAS